METQAERHLKPQEGGRNIKILVVEDVKFNQLLMKAVLEEYGFDSEIAENGKIAIEKLKNNSYDIILMDLLMPEMGGFEATEYIRSKMNPDIPIISLTADLTTVDIEKCRALGMNDYISKPIDDKELYKTIMKYIKKPYLQKPNSTRKNQDPGSHLYKHVNLRYLERLTSDNPQTMFNMIKTYLEETPLLLQVIEKGMDRKDWESVSAAAHSITPSFSIMGINAEYEEIIRKIQIYAEKKKNPEIIKELFPKINNVCNLAMKELQGTYCPESKIE